MNDHVGNSILPPAIRPAVIDHRLETKYDDRFGSLAYDEMRHWKLFHSELFGGRGGGPG